MTTKKKAFNVGWREIVGLPDLGIAGIKAKIDTGARTSALHSENVGLDELDGITWATFSVPITETSNVYHCRAKLLDQRDIKNTSGIPETRYIIETTLKMGNVEWPIEVSLADRDAMTFDLILGRTALKAMNIMVDPTQSFLTQKHS